MYVTTFAQVPFADGLERVSIELAQCMGGALRKEG